MTASFKASSRSPARRAGLAGAPITCPPWPRSFPFHAATWTRKAVTQTRRDLSRFRARGLRSAQQLDDLGRTPQPPRPRRSLVVVPVHTVSRLTLDALAAALSLGDRVVAVNVTHPEDEPQARAFFDDWDRWNPGVELVQFYDAHRRLDTPLLTYLAQVPETHVFVLIAEVEPEHVRQRMLPNQRGAVLARALRRRTDAVVCRMRFRVKRERPAATA